MGDLEESYFVLIGYKINENKLMESLKKNKQFIEDIKVYSDGESEELDLEVIGEFFEDFCGSDFAEDCDYDIGFLNSDDEGYINFGYLYLVMDEEDEKMISDKTDESLRENFKNLMSSKYELDFSDCEEISEVC